MQIRLIVTGLILTLTTMASGAAEAQRPQSLGVFTDWQAFQAVEGNGQLVCFIASKPTNSQGDYTRRGPIWLLVAHRPGVQTNVVSMEAGFSFKPDANPVATIDSSRFALFTQRETGWAFPDDDDDLIASMKAGITMLVDSVSTRGTEIRDTFSLRGFTKAYNRISEACRIS